MHQRDAGHLNGLPNTHASESSSDDNIEQHICHVCIQAFGDLQALAQHRRATGHDQICWCGRQCASPEALLIHQCDAGHLDGPPENDSDDASSDSLDGLEQHLSEMVHITSTDLQNHQEEYVCDICDRRFRSAQSRSQHQRDTGHDNVQLFQARHSDSDLTARFSNDNTELHSCPACNRVFRSSHALAQHRHDTCHNSALCQPGQYALPSRPVRFSALWQQRATPRHATRPVRFATPVCSATCWCGRQCASSEALLMHQCDTGHLDGPPDNYSDTSSSDGFSLLSLELVD